jgi:hypothetical protein
MIIGVVSQCLHLKQNMMKTGLQWLMEMPYRYQVLFLKRYSEQSTATIAWYLLETSISFEDYIGGAFIWQYTPEGGDFWSSIRYQNMTQNCN